MSVITMESLKFARKMNHLSQKDVAQKLGINRVSYARYESGEREPDLATLDKLATMFGVSVDFLMKRPPFSEWENILKNRDSLSENLAELLLPLLENTALGKRASWDTDSLSHALETDDNLFIEALGFLVNDIHFNGKNIDIVVNFL